MGSHGVENLGSLGEGVVDRHGGRLALDGGRRRGGVDVAKGLHGDVSVGRVGNLEAAATQIGLIERKR